MIEIIQLDEQQIMNSKTSAVIDYSTVIEQIEHSAVAKKWD